MEAAVARRANQYLDLQRLLEAGRRFAPYRLQRSGLPVGGFGRISAPARGDHAGKLAGGNIIASSNHSRLLRDGQSGPSAPITR